MSANCASCRYPLTVSDSVVCHQCWSYFHIDCAQLVGFPWFVLSGEPGKNTFHCTTCQLLPLPEDRDDSSDDEGMPSRQLDIALEGEADLAKDMNEVKGGIQDLSDLCKDMLREINDLKSINLTLRCCVENLRHDNEQRDAVISELKLRLDLLEGKYSGRNTTDSSNLDQSRSVEKEEVETPYELECTRINASSNLAQNVKYDRKIDLNLEDTSSIPKESSSVNDSEDEAVWEKENEDLKTDIYVNENKQNEDTETGYVDYKRNYAKENELNQDLFAAKEEVKAEIVNEKNQSKQDWSWRGNQAVEVEKEDNTNEEEEEESEEETETEEKDSQSWQKLEEEFESLVKQEDEVEGSLSEDEFWELQQDEKSEEKQELGTARKSVRWEEGIADDDSESEADWSQKEIKEAEVEELKNEEASDVDEETRVHEDLPVEDDLEGRLEAGEELLVEPTESAEQECRLESSEFATEGEEDHLEIREGTSDVETSLEHGEVLPESESHLEEDGTEAVSNEEEGIHREEEAENDKEFRLEEAENEESRLDMPEFSEEQAEFTEGQDQPPESPPSIHTEEDLWLYLRDNVSAERPSTVEEFVQNLIGTLQHVPEEYLKPVIDANIRRIKTPSVTDGEHLRSPEDEEVNNVGPLEGENLQETQDTSEGIFTSAKEEVLSQFPGGALALEAAD